MSVGTTFPESLSGLRVFIVEDETLVLMNLEGMLEDIGCVVAGSAMRPSQLQGDIERGIEADAAILDVNIGGTLVFDYARQIAERDIRIVFATGYGKHGLPEEWLDRPVVQKPYSTEDVARALQAALAG